jgi:hypothetical protein
MQSLLLAALFMPVWMNPHVGLRSGPWIEPLWGILSIDGYMSFVAIFHATEEILESRLVLEYGSCRHVEYPYANTNIDAYWLSVTKTTSEGLPFLFTNVIYWWEVDLRDGNTIASEKQTLFFFDTRFKWKQFSKNNVTLYWWEGDPEAAEVAADLTLFSLGGISAELETPIPENITVVMYSWLTDLQSTMPDRLHGWEGAISDGKAGVILLAAAPGVEGRKTLAMLIPHEVTHILLVTGWGEAYDLFPFWLVEGIATGYEMEPWPKADLALREAVDAGSTIPIRALCAVFPVEEQAAMLAYAESKSFVAFIKEKYGLSAIRNAFAAYAGGADCNVGMEVSTGSGLEKLEADWMNTLSGSKSWIPSSWVIVLAGVIMLGGVLAVRGMIGRRNTTGPADKGRDR